VRRPEHQRAACDGAKFKELEERGQKVEATAIGSKGLGFLNRFGAKVVSHVVHLGDTPHLDKLIGAVKVQLDVLGRQAVGRVPRVHRFINTMKQEAVVEQLLPLSADHFDAKTDAGHVVGLHLRAGRAGVVDELLVRYVEALVYQAVAKTWRPSNRRAWWR
jgi:F-type H+-transporting ATPase subunit gamma